MTTQSYYRVAAETMEKGEDPMDIFPWKGNRGNGGRIPRSFNQLTLLYLKDETYHYPLLLSGLFLIPRLSQAQEKSELYNTILHMDSVLFDAFNNHELEILQGVFAPNAEFYHDRDGLSDYQTTMNNFKRVFAATPDLHRELVTGTLEVYPLPGYGALETGEHRFTLTQNGQKVTAVYKFTNIWQYKNDRWQVTRTISVGH